ncbi:regulatory iron-sulfur-containing complex subunit RicT [Hymenobacter sp. H14-R3]|uniref:PSP1 domain-containing protein n=1 Tax=Hymenobacter sp. H14-R3 TaxID=3046308 RepID=UPI0024B96CE1|nr:regulatory iron-sulfur-containing complex subunit RicT [Hymenobacter sp. H14-R3]MDJ0366869.1 regulatory iron-sulfur-containing complex subunit RicT [Hymenobacter sp. H14-R3]
MACTSCSSGGGCSTSKVGGCGSKGGCSSGGCTRLNVFDWLADVDMPSDFRGFDCVEIRFKGGRKEFFRNDQRLPLVTGDAVVVEAAGSGWHLGHVSLKGELVRLQMRKKKVPTDSRDIRPILRVATPDDEERWQAVRDLENGTMFRARAVVDELRLKMKLSDVEYQADRTRALFYYSAEDRVDFRELIRRLADEFRVRVEMRQISLRQEAGRIGGIGVCGRELCCSTWLTDFKAVSTTAARYQNLSLNPQKLAGQCGRLKCCLNYELDAYLDALKDIPQVQRPLQVAGGEAFLQKTDIFRKRMWFAFKGDNNWVMLSAERVREVLEMNKKGEKPDALLAPRQEEEIAPAVSTLMEGDLDRLDDQIKGGSKRSKRKRKDRPEGTLVGSASPSADVQELREPREPRRRERIERPAGQGAESGRPPRQAGPGSEATVRPPSPAGPAPETPPTNPRPEANAPSPATPPTEGQPEQRGRRGAAARPLNRRSGRGRESGEGSAPRNTGDGSAQEPRPRRNDPAAGDAVPRPPREGNDQPRPDGTTGRNRGRRGGSGRRGSEGNSAPTTPPSAS